MALIEVVKKNQALEGQFVKMQAPHHITSHGLAWIYDRTIFLQPGIF